MGNVIDLFLERGFLISPDFLNRLTIDFALEDFLKNLSERFKEDRRPIVICNDFASFIPDGESLDLDWVEFEKARVLFENGKDTGRYKKFLILNPFCKEEASKFFEDDARLKILRLYDEKPKKLEVNDFVSYFRARYNSLANILKNRLELRTAISISKLINKNTGNVAAIGIINEKKINKNGSIIVQLEDPTGNINVFVNKNEECYNLAKDFVLDEVVGITGTLNNRTIFANNVYFPDVPLAKEVKKADREIGAAFISDLHVGSKLFLEENFLKFISWLNCEHEEKQTKIARKVKYLFIIGDIVDGVGVYPEQEKELMVKDIKEQYNYCARLLSKIRRDIKVIMCAGQHDALRLSEPQSPLNKEFAPDFYDMPNIFLVSNPALINIASSGNFEGFNVLIYHGASFHYFINNIENLRLSNARDNPGMILKFLLQKRHLAPSHGSTLYLPTAEKDLLVVEEVPDIFVSGEMHRSSVLNYNNVIMINCSCWQIKTDFQERTGNNPDPCRVPIINLKTRKVKILDFS